MNLALLSGYFVLALMVAHHIRCRQDALWVLGLLLAAGTVAAGYGLLQYYGVLPSNEGSGPGAMTMIATFGNKNYLGGYLTYLLFPSLGLLILAGQRWVKILVLASISLLFAALLRIEQDAIWIALLISGILLLVGIRWGGLWGQVKQNRSWVVGLLSMSIFLALLGTTIVPREADPQVAEPTASVQTLFTEASRPFTDASARVRILDWGIGLEMLRDHPLLGVGLGNYKLQYLSYKAEAITRRWGMEFADVYVPPAAQAHSDYLQWAAETGLVGLLALLFAIGYLLLHGLRGFFQEPNLDGRFLRLVLLAGIATLGAHAMVDFPLHLPASALTLVVFVGILFSPHLKPPTTAVKRKGPSSRMAAVVVFVAALGFLVLGMREFQANVHLTRAMSLGSWGDLRGAQQELEQSLALSFAPAQNALLLGTIYFLQGRDAESLPLFRLAVRSRPSELAYLQLGQTLLLLGKREEGRQTLQDLLAMAPRSEVSVEAYRLRELSQSPWVKELLTLERWMQMGLDSAAQQKIESLSLEELDLAAQLELLRLRSERARAQGRLMEARTLLQQALEKDPKAEWAYVELAEIAGEEQPTEAEAFLSRAGAILEEKLKDAAAELAATSPSPERQIVRARLEVLRQIQRDINQLEQRIAPAR